MGDRITETGIRHLGRVSNAPVTELDLIAWVGGHICVQLDCGEFTSLCPVTGQADFGRIIIEYVPNEYLIETKSLKLYLASFRNRAEFNEKIVNEVADTIYAQIAPIGLRVEGAFNVRGGISVNTTAERGAIL